MALLPAPGSVYYFFFEKCRDVILTSKSKVAATNATTQAAKIAAGGALTTLESMLAGAIAGSATTLISNPIWVISTRQAVRAAPPKAAASASSSKTPAVPVKKLGFVQTIQHIFKTDGLTAFWKGIGPSLVLVINPILQYTAFERLRSMTLDGKKKRGAVARLSDLEVFFLGALSKLLATGLTYPQIGECSLFDDECGAKASPCLSPASHQEQTAERRKGRLQRLDGHDGHCEPGGVSAVVLTNPSPSHRSRSYRPFVPQLCWPVPRHHEQAAAERADGCASLCQQGAHLRHHKKGHGTCRPAIAIVICPRSAFLPVQVQPAQLQCQSYYCLLSHRSARLSSCSSGLSLSLHH